MIGMILLFVSIGTLGQFGLFYWRAMMIRVSARAVSDRLGVAAGIVATAIGAHDFGAILSTHNLVPNLGGSGGSFRAVRTYYCLVEKLGRMIPATAKWAEAEMTTCSHYAAVLVGQHLERNHVCAAEMRGI
jgi:hypothetical protein